MNKNLIKNTTFNIKYLWGAPGWERVQTAPPDTAPPLVKGWPWGRRLAAESLWWSYCPWEEEKKTQRRTSQHGEKYGENLALRGRFWIRREYPINLKSFQGNSATQVAIWSLRHTFSRRKTGRRDRWRIYTRGMKKYLLNCVFSGLLIKGKEGG